MLSTENLLTKKFNALSPYLDEKRLRLWAATEALSLPKGNLALISKITGLSRTTIYSGITELSTGGSTEITNEMHIRKVGGGRKTTLEKDPKLIKELECL